MVSNVFLSAFGFTLICVVLSDRETSSERELRCSKLEEKCKHQYPQWNTNREQCLGACLWRTDNHYSEKGELIRGGDMLLSPHQVDQFYKVTRKAIKNLDYRWPEGIIPFAFNNHSEAERKVILLAMDHWMTHTCIKFKQVVQDSKFAYLNFLKENGCYSTVGKKFNSSGPQTISIGQGCAKIGIAIHEIGHAVGFLHEHCRRDRDKLIRIQYDNVAKNLHSNFIYRHDINDYGVPYDLSSVMQYTWKEFTMNGKNTIVTLDPWQQFDIGLKSKLSFSDIKIANLMYNCSDHCQDKPICKNGGFVNKFCKCECPPNATGDCCDIYVPISRGTGKQCGGEILDETIITTPNYPKNYSGGTRCIWWIKAPVGLKISFTFLDFDLYPQSRANPGCRHDYVEIRKKNTLDGDNYCGNESNNTMLGRSFISKRNEMIILFATKYSKNRGFEASVQFFNCSDV